MNHKYIVTLTEVVCLDETNRQLIEKRSIPAKPGTPGREDHEYRRCGVADLFVALSLPKATTGYASGKKELKARGKVDKKRPPR